MKRKLSFLLLYGCLVLFGGLGALLLYFGDKAPRPSLTENRMLAGFPTLSLVTLRDGSFMAGLEDYLSDGMFERDRIVEGISLVMDRVRLDRSGEAAEDAELFDQVAAFAQEQPAPAPTDAPLDETPAEAPVPATAEPAPTDAPAEASSPAEPAPAVEEKDLSTIPACTFTCTRPNGTAKVIYTFPPKNIRRMVRVLNAYRALLPADGHMFFAEPPFPAIAASIQHGEYVGWGSDLEDTINAYANDGVTMLSVLDILEPHLLAGEYLFFTTDHHWTPRSACYTANAFLRTLGITPRPYDEYAFKVCRTFYGSAASNHPEIRSTHKPDTLDILIPDIPVKGYVVKWDGKEQEAPLIYPDATKYTAYLGGTKGPWRRFETGVDCGRSCLVIGDSFANAFLPFLTPYYETVHMTDIRGEYYDPSNIRWSISDYIRKYEIDDVYFVLSTASGVNTEYLIKNLLNYL